jgi:serine/threonine-protein kinase
VADSLAIDEIEWARDHQWLVYRTGAVAERRRIAMTALPSKAGVAIEPGTFDNYMPTLSPDGRWLAYVNVETGREEVYVRPFPNTGDARWQVSSAGGTSPAWSHSGRELFFVDGTGRMVSAPVLPGPAFQAGEPTTLFTLDRIVLPPFHQGFAVTPDDQHFLMLQDPSTANADGRFATLTLNALAGLGVRR